MNTPVQQRISRETTFIRVEAMRKQKRLEEKKNTTSSVVRPLFHVQPIPTIVRHTEALQFQMDL